MGPGDSGRIPVYYRGLKQPWDWNVQLVDFELGVLTGDDTTPIDWDEIEPLVRPNDIVPDLWGAIWPQITSQIGATWAGYLQVLDDNASHLASRGRRTHNVRELFSFEVAKAVGAFILPRTLASSSDAYSPAPGLPLVFARVATDSLSHRFHVGPLGRGWSHNFEYSLDRPDDYTAVVEGPGRMTRTFARLTPWSVFQARPGDYGVLVERSDGTHQVREKDGLAWSFDLDGRLVSIQEPNGNHIALSYVGDRLTDVTHSNGQALTIQYDTRGRIESLTDYAGRQTQYIYEGTGEYLVNVIAPGDRATGYEYVPVVGSAADHGLESIVFPDGTHLYYGYDALGRLAAQWRDGGAERVEFDYATFDTVIVRDAAESESRLRYGLPGQLSEVVNPLGHAVSFEYGEGLTFTGVTGSDGGAYELAYDSRGNLTDVSDPLGRTVSMGYTADYDRLAWLVDQNGNRTDFTTDASGSLTAIVYPDASAESFEYDSAGNVVSFTNRRGQTITYTYDAFTRLAVKEYPGGRLVTYAYDAVGRLTEVTDASGTIAMEYDASGFLTRIAYPDGHWFTFAYNEAGRRTQRVGDDGYVLNYQYDAAGRLERLADGSGTEVIRYEYDGAGRLIGEAKGNGTFTTYEYDAAGQVLRLVNYAPDGAVQSQFDYIYDENGNRTSMTTLGATTCYEYDAIGQLVTVSYSDGRQVTYDYDPAGNRTLVTDGGAQTSYTTNNMNQYTEAGDTTYGYDADGNMTSKANAQGETTYEYDEENRLVRGVTLSDGTWEYTYDALGNLVGVSHGGDVSRYMYDPIGYGDVERHYDGSGQLRARYIHGFGLIAREAPSAALSYYAFDALGNTSELTDAGVLVANSYSYDSFGFVLGASETIANPFQFVGKYGVMRKTTDLDFMRNRFYASSLGRFISSDPLGFHAGELNSYSYAGNAPITWVDPAGLSKYDQAQWEASYAVGGLAAYGEHSGRVAKFGKFGRGAGKGAAMLGVGLGAFEVYEGVREGDRLKVSHGVGHWGLATVGIFAFAVSNPVGWTAVGAGALALAFDVAADLHAERVKAQESTGAEWESGYGVAPPPDPPALPAGEGSVQRRQSVDPNEKIGPAGFGDGGFMTSDQPMPYTIYFENEPEATAAAVEVHITDQLADDLDWTTFELLGVSFGSHVVTIPSGTTHYETSMEIDGWTFNDEEGWHTGETPLIVEVEVDIDIGGGEVTWSIVSYDPATGWAPEDASAGFLPPDDPDDLTHRGEGHVSYMIRPRSGLPTGTPITNMANIVFDVNPPIETPQTLNTIDDGAPASRVTELPPSTAAPSFSVDWIGLDDAGGCGIAGYDVYVAIDASPFALWVSTADTSAVFNGQPGHTYAFYSVATDNVGNHEAPPQDPDATTRVNAPPVCDAGGPYNVECDGAATVVAPDGTGSFDLDDETLTYAWSTDCPGAGLDDPASPTPTVTVSTDPGCHVPCSVTLTVDDGLASDTCTTAVAIADTTSPAVFCSATLVPEDENDHDDDEGDGDDDGDDDGAILIEFGASDACGSVVVSAVVNIGCLEIPIVDGQMIELECEDEGHGGDGDGHGDDGEGHGGDGEGHGGDGDGHGGDEEDDCEVEYDDGILEIEARVATLIITAEDECGNAGTCTVDLCALVGNENDD